MPPNWPIVLLIASRGKGAGRGPDRKPEENLITDGRIKNDERTKSGARGSFPTDLACHATEIVRG